MSPSEWNSCRLDHMKLWSIMKCRILTLQRTLCYWTQNVKNVMNLTVGCYDRGVLWFHSIPSIIFSSKTHLQTTADNISASYSLILPIDIIYTRFKPCSRSTCSFKLDFQPLPDCLIGVQVAPQSLLSANQVKAENLI
jgi:hypothetical protein